MPQLAVREIYLTKALRSGAASPTTLSIIFGDFNTTSPVGWTSPPNLPDYSTDDGVGAWVASTFGELTAIAHDGYSRCGFHEGTPGRSRPSTTFWWTSHLHNPEGRQLRRDETRPTSLLNVTYKIIATLHNSHLAQALP